MSELAQQAKEYWTTNHNQHGRVLREGHEHRWQLADYIIKQFAPESVFEFGCGAGRNLAVLRELDEACILGGFDGNQVSVERGREAHKGDGIVITLGDEKSLEAVSNSSFDVVFTVSVLDHIPDPEWRAVYDNLKRIARKAVVLLEPVEWADDYSGEMVEHDYEQDPDLAITDFTWSHDYRNYDPQLNIIKPLPLTLGGNWQRFGDAYTLMSRWV